MRGGTTRPAGGHKRRPAASLICWRFSAKFTASRIRLSCHGDFGSHWSANSTQKIDACFEDTTCIRGSRLRPSASGPSSTYPTSASPLLSITAPLVASRPPLPTRPLPLRAPPPPPRRPPPPPPPPPL